MSESSRRHSTCTTREHSWSRPCFAWQARASSRQLEHKAADRLSISRWIQPGLSAPLILEYLPSTPPFGTLRSTLILLGPYLERHVSRRCGFRAGPPRIPITGRPTDLMATLSTGRQVLTILPGSQSP